MKKGTKAATESLVMILVVAGILVALNALSALGGYGRLDMTKTQRYTLSNGSGNLLKSMKQNMTVDAYVTKGVPKLDAFVRDLRDLLMEYKQSSGGKFDFNLIEAKDEETKKKAEEAGLVAQPFVQTSDTEDKAAVAKGYMGLVFRYGDQQDAIKFLPPDRTDGLEFWITNKIREIRDTGDNVKHIVGVVTGKDELKLTDTNLAPASMGKLSLQGIIQQNFKFYQLQEVDLKGGESPIDEKLDGLIITQPGKDFTEAELRRIDEFVLKGKSLAVFASAVNVPANNPAMTATLNTWGLEKLLEGYGIELRKDVILDFKHAFHVNVMSQTGVARAWFPQFLAVDDDSRYTGDEQLLDSSFPAFFRLPELVAPFSSSLILHPEKQPGATLKVHARSTEKAVRRTEATVELKPFSRILPKGEPGQYAIAASLEFEPKEGKKLKSAFPGGDRKGAPEESDKPARIFVMASSQFLTNPLARAGNGPEQNPQMHMMMPGGGGDEQLLQLAGPYAQQALTSSIVAFKNTLDWASGDTDLLAVSAKIVSEPNLVYGDVSTKDIDPNASEEELKKRDDEMRQGRKSKQVWVSWILILGIPLLFVLFGGIRWQLRQSSRSKASLA